ncbi:MAG: rhodanese-like domain-containing protein, partial [Planctomycetota bacterium]
LPNIYGDDAQLQEAKKIVVYGSDSIDPLPLAGAKKMLALGYVNIYQYRGGVVEWQEKGRQLQSTDGETRPEGE